MEAKEVSKQIRKFIDNKIAMPNVSDIASIIGVTKPTLYRKISDNDFSDREINELLKHKIITKTTANGKLHIPS